MTTPGLYKHFKGALYRVLMTATEATTSQIIVVYVPLYGQGLLRWRTEQDFTVQVERIDYTGPRFYRIGD
jgi:hypothetical protein